MRAKRIVFASMALGSVLSLIAQDAPELATELITVPQYMADATFEVLLPSASDPVIYDVTLQSAAPDATDSLSVCDYIIRWSARTSAEPLAGFSAYFSGNHFRYRNHRLQEYHADANVEPFMPYGPGSQYTNGVHTTAQFADMLPQNIGKAISRILNDSSYIYSFHPDTLVNGKKSIVLDGVKRGNGYDLMRFSYVFDKNTHLPVMSEFENSPGSISEQLVTVSYSPKSKNQPIEISEEGLLAQWPEVFERFRESTFKSENLAGTLLPEFSCQTLDTPVRYTHNPNEPLQSPIIIVMLDPEVSTTRQTIDDIRSAVDMAPMAMEVLWAFNTNRTDDIRDAIGRLRPGEHALVSANSLMRNCGITLFPTTIIVDKSSKIKDVVPGYNNETGLVVLQKAMLIN